MIYWAPLLHFYQPPIQMPSVLRRVCDEAYRPILRVLDERLSARVTVNINGSLTELLAEQGGDDVLGALRSLAERGRIEFVATGKYHPILPLIPADEMRRQIALNYQTNRHHFGESFSPGGFFPPELCYDPVIVDTIVETGHQWMLLSGIACPTSWPLARLHRVDGQIGSLDVVFRDDFLSNDISFRGVDPEDFIARLRALVGDQLDIYVVTAMDAETFGHHIAGWEEQFLARVFDLAERESDIRVVTVGEIRSRFPRGEAIVPLPSSWSTTDGDLAAGVPYPLWRSPGNAVHGLQWELIDICIDLVRRATAVADNDLARHHAQIARALLDRAMHSCQFWWASRRPMWDVNMVHRGSLQALEVVLNAHKAIGTSGASAAEKTSAYHQVIVARELAGRIGDLLLAE